MALTRGTRFLHGAAASGETLASFTAQRASGRVALDDRKDFIRKEEPFVYHTKMVRYADLYHHLLKVLCKSQHLRFSKRLPNSSIGWEATR